MPWRALLRVVDFQALLAAQPGIAEALDAAARAHGPRSWEARTLREGFHLVAKVLWTRRAGIPQVHDLAWLDHAVVSAGTRLGKEWEGEEARTKWAGLRTAWGPVDTEAGARDSSWVAIPVDAFGGSGEVKLERGTAGPYEVRIVTRSETKAFLEALEGIPDDDPARVAGLRDDATALATSARRADSPAVALVFAASSLGDLAAE